MILETDSRTVVARNLDTGEVLWTREGVGVARSRRGWVFVPLGTGDERVLMAFGDRMMVLDTDSGEMEASWILPEVEGYRGWGVSERCEDLVVVSSQRSSIDGQVMGIGALSGEVLWKRNGISISSRETIAVYDAGSLIELDCSGRNRWSHPVESIPRQLIAKAPTWVFVTFRSGPTGGERTVLMSRDGVEIAQTGSGVLVSSDECLIMQEGGQWGCLDSETGRFRWRLRGWYGGRWEERGLVLGVTDSQVEVVRLNDGAVIGRVPLRGSRFSGAARGYLLLQAWRHPENGLPTPQTIRIDLREELDLESLDEAR